MERDHWVEAVVRNWRTAALSETDRALCAFAEKLTLRPSGMEASDVGNLRRLGFEDGDIHHAIQVVSYFNYINRIADAVHVDLEPGMDPYPEPKSRPSTP